MDSLQQKTCDFPEAIRTDLETSRMTGSIGTVLFLSAAKENAFAGSISRNTVLMANVWDVMYYLYLTQKLFKLL